MLNSQFLPEAKKHYFHRNQESVMVVMDVWSKLCILIQSLPCFHKLDPLLPDQNLNIQWKVWTMTWEFLSDWCQLLLSLLPLIVQHLAISTLILQIIIIEHSNWCCQIYNSIVFREQNYSCIIATCIEFIALWSAIPFNCTSNNTTSPQINNVLGKRSQ